MRQEGPETSALLWSHSSIELKAELIHELNDDMFQLTRQRTTRGHTEMTAENTCKKKEWPISVHLRLLSSHRILERKGSARENEDEQGCLFTTDVEK